MNRSCPTGWFKKSNTKQQFVKLIKTNKTITGHSSDVVFSRYNKIDRDDINEAADKLEIS